MVSWSACRLLCTASRPRSSGHPLVFSKVYYVSFIHEASKIARKPYRLVRTSFDKRDGGLRKVRPRQSAANGQVCPAAESANAARLRYVSDKLPGIRRVRRGKGFR